MPKADAVHFVDQARTNDAIRKALSEATTPADIVQVGRSHGFTFSESEFKEVKDELDTLLQSERELSDAELEHAAGGVRTATFQGVSASFSLGGQSSGTGDVCTAGNVGGSPITCMKIPDWTTKNITCD